MVGQAAVGQDPGVDPRMERLHPAVEHLGKSGDGRDVGDRQARLAERPGGPAGRHELEAEVHESPPEVDETGLVADRQERPARDRQRQLGGGDIDGRRTPVGPDRTGQDECDGTRQDPVLDRPDPIVEGGFVVVVSRIGPPPGRRSGRRRGLVHEVDRRPADPRAVGERIADRVRAGERGQQRRVGVEDPPAERRQDRRPDDPHVARRGPRRPASRR